MLLTTTRGQLLPERGQEALLLDTHPSVVSCHFNTALHDKAEGKKGCVSQHISNNSLRGDGQTTVPDKACVSPITGLASMPWLSGNLNSWLQYSDSEILELTGALRVGTIRCRVGQVSTQPQHINQQSPGSCC